MKLIEGKTYRFKELCELRNSKNFNQHGKMDYLAGTIVTVYGIDHRGEFQICNKNGDGVWFINASMLEEVCEDLQKQEVYPYLVMMPKSRIITKHLSEENALEEISSRIEGGTKGTYLMYQLYQEVETPKLDISSMIRKIVDKIIAKDS